MKNSIAVITGGSSGIGLCTAKALLQSGYHVYELSRRDSSNEGIVHIKCDVTDNIQVKEAIDKILGLEGHIDILINNAGFGISGAIEFTHIEDVKRQFDVNFFGMVRVNSNVLPIMRNQGYGRIINLSSVAAPVPIPFQAYYSASKAAINAYSMALANEVTPFNIRVTAIMPGDIKTGFTAARKKEAKGDDIYQGRISRSIKVMEKDEQNGMDPMVAGRFIAKVAMSKSKKPLRTIGLSYRLVIVLTKILPARIQNWIVKLIYAK